MINFNEEELQYIGRSLYKSPLRSHFGTTIVVKLSNERKISSKEGSYLGVAIYYNTEETSFSKSDLTNKIYMCTNKELLT